MLFQTLPVTRSVQASVGGQSFPCRGGDDPGDRDRLTTLELDRQQNGSMLHAVAREVSRAGRFVVTCLNW